MDIKEIKERDKLNLCGPEDVTFLLSEIERLEKEKKEAYNKRKNEAFQEAIEIVFKTPFKGEVSFANFQDNIIKALKEKMDRE